MTTFVTILIALWTYPVVTFFLVKFTRNKPIVIRKIIKITLGINILTIIGLVTNISTANKEVDWIILTSLYFSTCLFLWLGVCHSSRIVKIFSYIAMVCIFSIGYLSCTFGIMGVGFAMFEFVPKSEKWLGDGIIYKETMLGNAISDYRGKRIEIYKTISWLPIIECRIQHKDYYNVLTFCDDLKVDYSPKLKTIYLSTFCNEGKDKQLKSWTDTLYLGKRLPKSSSPGK